MWFNSNFILPICLLFEFEFLGPTLGTLDTHSLVPGCRPARLLLTDKRLCADLQWQQMTPVMNNCQRMMTKWHRMSVAEQWASLDFILTYYRHKNHKIFVDVNVCYWPHTCSTPDSSWRGTLDTVIGSRDKVTQGGREEGDIVLSPQLVTHK